MDHRVDDSLGHISKDLVDDVTQLVRAEVDLAKAQFEASASRLMASAILASVAAAFIALAVTFAFAIVPVAFGKTWFGQEWIGWAVMAGTFLLLAIILGGIAYVLIKKITSSTRETVESIKEDVEWATKLMKQRRKSA